MPQQRRYIQPGLAVNVAAVVLHRHDARTGFGKQLGRDAAHIAKTLHRHTCAGHLQPQVPRCFNTHRVDTAPGGLAPPE